MDLAEAGDPVAVATRAGRVHRGVIEAVGTDFVLVGAESGQLLLRHHAVVWVRQDRTPRAPRGDRPLALTMSFEEALRATLEPRERVQVVVSALPDPVNGAVITLGVDVLTLQPNHESRVHLTLANVDEVVFDPRR